MQNRKKNNEISINTINPGDDEDMIIQAIMEIDGKQNRTGTRSY